VLRDKVPAIYIGIQGLRGKKTPRSQRCKARTETEKQCQKNYYTHPSSGASDLNINV
jgi:hypothetical protein